MRRWINLCEAVDRNRLDVDGVSVRDVPMTAEQAAALDSYMWHTWGDVNAGLRGEADLSRHAGLVAILDDLADDRLIAPAMLYRRSIHPLEALRDTAGHPIRPGFTGQIRLAGFTSTSFDRDEVENFSAFALGDDGTDILWVIRAAAGTRGIYADGKLAVSHLPNHLNQREFILARNTVPTVHRIIEDGSGYRLEASV